MSRLPAILKGAGAGRTVALTAAGLCLLACGGGAVLAQETGTLRGPLIASEINPVLLPGAQGERARRQDEARQETGAGQTNDYAPVSAGALDSGDSSSTVGDGTDSLDAGFDGGTFGPRRTVSTARQRRNERRDALLPAGQRSPAPDADTDGAESDTAADGDIAAPARSVGATGSIASERTRLENLPAGASSRVLRRDEGNPFAPLGLRLGSFIVTPTLEQGLTATNNVDSSPEGGSGILNETTLRLNAASNWSRHSLTVDARGTYRKSISGNDYSEFEGALNSRLELDIRSDLRGIATFDYVMRPEDASSPVEIANVEDRPLRQIVNGSLGVEKDAGRLRFGLTGRVERDQYGDAELSDGTSLSQEDRNNTLVSAVLRGGYALSPAIMPFVEAEIGRRIYDQTIDSAGYERSATRTGARAGIELDLREKLNGEFSAGWISEDADDDRLATISGPTVAASLQWSPLRGTTVRLDGATMVESTTDVGESGSILYSALLSAQRQIRSNLTGSAAFGLGWRDYDVGGHEMTLSAEAALTWWLNRNLGITGRARHERLKSDLPGRDYDVSSVYLGVTLQR